MRMIARLLSVFIASAALSACASISAYAPQTTPGGEGYFKQRIDETHWRVEFVGDETASAAIVERDLLFRAAQLTRASGYDWFMPSEHRSDGDTEIVIEAPRQTAGGVLGAPWRPYLRRRGPLGWSDWNPRGPVPLEEHPAPQPTTWSFVRYSAHQTIEMGHGDKPANAFGAVSTADLLSPTAQRSH